MRIAAALKRLAPQEAPPVDWSAAPAYVWTGRSVRRIDLISAPPLSRFQGIDRQRDTIAMNVARHAAGEAAHDMLLWGARGTGKSALFRSAVKAARDSGANVALVQVAGDALIDLPDLFAALRAIDRQFWLFLDDLGFAADEPGGPRRLRSWLEGGVEARPANCRLAVTTNRRAIVHRNAERTDDGRHARDDEDDDLALADRFGLSLGFHVPDQETYLAIVRAHAEPLGLAVEDAKALEWARRRGARSGRTAWQYVVELAGQAGLPGDALL